MVSPDHAPAVAPPSFGELVVLNGHQAGLRQPLTSPVTLLGQADHCDVRLEADGVCGVHCILACGLAGIHLRDLGSDSGTTVNGQPFLAGPISANDCIGVGPFQFRVELPAVPAEEPLARAALEAERDAMRIQTAAVVAQQAALVDEENRLGQRRTALEHQKEQLASHLEQRRQDLRKLQEQTRSDRAAFRQECDKTRRELEESRQALDKDRQTLAHGCTKTVQERRRVVELRKRLKRRWRRQFDGQCAQLACRERDLANRSETLQVERAAFQQARLEFNAEAELGRLRLKEEWQQLGLAQQEWEAVINDEHARSKAERENLENRELAVGAAEQALAERLCEGEQRLAALESEAQGLEARILNQRQKLVDPSQPSRTEPVAYPLALPLLPRQPAVPLPQAITRLACNLTFQRYHLLDQWQHLLEVQDTWHADRVSVLSAIESALAEVDQRDLRLAAVEKAMDTAQGEVRRRQEELTQAWAALEGWRARQAQRESAWEADRATLLTEVEARAGLAGAAATRLEELHQQHVRLLAEEREALRQARDQWEMMRTDYVSAWQGCQKLQAGLARRQRQLEAQALALEDLRQELIIAAADPPAATRRLERLQRRHAARLQSEARSIEEERQRIATETLRLDDLARRLREQDDALAKRLAECSGQEQAYHEARVSAADAEVRRRQELQRLQNLHALETRRSAQLQDEVERLARLLLDEPDPPRLTTSPANQAA
jgi:hypothetical protein